MSEYSQPASDAAAAIAAHLATLQKASDAMQANPLPARKYARTHACIGAECSGHRDLTAGACWWPASC